MKKQYIEIKIENKVIAVCAVKECEPLDFVKIKKEAEENLNHLLENFKNKIKNLENDVKILKGEE